MCNKNNEESVTFKTVCQLTADQLDMYVCDIKYFAEDSKYFYLSASSDRLFDDEDLPPVSEESEEDEDSEVKIPLFLRVSKQKDEENTHLVEGTLYLPDTEVKWSWYTNIE